MTRTTITLAALLTASPAAADLCNQQWLQQASGRDVQRHVQATNADVNRVCNAYRNRPLHLALTFDGVDSDVVESLLNAGADAERANSFGDSPRALADSVAASTASARRQPRGASKPCCGRKAGRERRLRRRSS